MSGWLLSKDTARSCSTKYTSCCVSGWASKQTTSTRALWLIETLCQNLSGAYYQTCLCQEPEGTQILQVHVQHLLTQESPEMMGAFHYVRPTNHRPVGLTKESGMSFYVQTWPTNRNGSYHFLFVVPIPHISENLLKRSRAAKSICQKGTAKFWSKRPDWLKWTCFRGAPEYSSRAEWKRTFTFDFWPKFMEFLT